MIVMDFLDKVKDLGIFSTADVDILYPNMDRRRLFEWKLKGYIKKIRNDWYCIPEFLEDPYSSWIIANQVHAPSYISLESALDHYGLIPEGVFMTTSVTTKRPIQLTMAGHDYAYSHIQTKQFKGYGLIASGTYARKIRLATLEKALVDFFYFRSSYKTSKEISELRFNGPVLREHLRKEPLLQHLDEFQNKELEKRVHSMLKIYYDA
jgi:predicted transcriptional regulator of viral defense system